MCLGSTESLGCRSDESVLVFCQDDDEEEEEEEDIESW